MRALIFANGEMSQPGSIIPQIQPGDLVVAADGGSLNCKAAGILPQVVIGDFDSLTEEEFKVLQAGGAQFIRYPARKDYTDLELALQYAKSQGANEILIYGALGKRWDQTLANLLLPAESSFSGINIRLVDGPQEIALIKPGLPFEIHGSPGDIVSLIPLSSEAGGIVTQGLEYPLEGESLYFGSTRGISNVLIATAAVVKLSSGLLLCVLIRNLKGVSKST